MTLDYRVVPVVFNQGLDTKTQRKLVVPGKWLALDNVTLATDYSLRRRDGTAALVSTANGNGLATHGDQLLVVSGGTVNTLTTAGTDAVVAVAGSLGFVTVGKEEVRRSTGMQDTPDCATGGGFTCYVWREKSPANAALSVNVAVIDETTGARLIANTAMRTNVGVFGARVVYANGAFFIFYIQGTSLYCRTVLTSAPTTLNAEVALITSASLAALNFDACAFGTGSTAMVSYAWADGVTSVRTIRVDQAAGVPSIGLGPTNLLTEVQLPVATLTGLCCAAYSNGANAATFATSTGAAAMAGLAGVVIDTTWAVTTAATQLDNAVAATTSNVHVTACQMDTSGGGVGLQVFWDRQSEWATNALNPLKTLIASVTLTTPVLPQQTLISSATFGAGVNARGPQGPFIAGKAFNSGGRVFLPVFVASVYNGLSPATANPRTANTQNTLFVLEVLNPPTYGIAGAVVVAKALYGSLGFASINGTAPTVGTPCSTPLLAAGGFAIAVSELTLLVLSSGNNVSPSGLVRLTLTPNVTAAPSKAQLGETTFFAGGSLAGYDGVEVSEVGFPLFPEGAAITVNGAGTGAMTAGVHQVVFIYEWVDGSGQRWQSAPSLPISVTVAATGSLTCQVPTLLLSQKAANIQVVAFMTQAGGLTFNRVLLDNGAYAPVMNALGATTVTLTIDDADATIAGNELLYTQPNSATSALASIAPGPCTSVWTAQNRLFFDKADKPGWFGYSQPYLNNVGLQFAPELEAALPVEGGGFSTGAELDEKVIVFGRRRIFAMFGTGPAASGAFNNYSAPQDIGADEGCSEPLSVLAAHPAGIIFKSTKGWYLLQRDLSVKYIGAAVASHDSATVTSAVLMGDRQECRFTLSTGITLVYSYAVDQWSTFSKVGAAYVVADAAWWPTLPGYVHVSTANGLNRDVAGALTDQPGAQAAVSVFISGQTSFLHLSALEGFQRVRWLYITATGPSGATPNSDFSLTVIYDDADVADSQSYSVSFNLATVMGSNTTKPVDVRHKLRRMKCKSVSFSFTEGQAGMTQALVGLQALALEVGFKKGVNRLPAGQTV